MTQLPDRPDLDQLRRAGQRAPAALLWAPRLLPPPSWPSPASTGSPAGLDCGRRWSSPFGGQPPWHLASTGPPPSTRPPSSWPRLRRRDGTPCTIPIGAIFTAQTFLTAHLDADPGFRLSDTLTPTNGRIFLTVAGPPVAVACLGVGAPAVGSGRRGPCRRPTGRRPRSWPRTGRRACS